MGSSRKFEKFLKEDGSLNTRLLPRPVYTKLVNEYRKREEVIDEIFAEMYLTWDLNEKLETTQRSGKPIDKAAVAQAVLDTLDDDDWWRVMSAFERAMARDFSGLACEWSDLLDPIYEDQEARGWVDMQ